MVKFLKRAGGFEMVWRVCDEEEGKTQVGA